MYDEMKAYVNDCEHDVELYSELFKIMESFRFTAPNCPIDANLIAYAQDLWLRKRIPLKRIGECTVLEALVGIAARHVDIRVYVNDEEEARLLTAKIFWELLGNLGLLDYTNDRLYKALDDEELEISDCHKRDIYTTINRFLNRNFEDNGYYSPFYLNLPVEELPKSWFTSCYWMQMDWWWEKNSEKFNKNWRYLNTPSLESQRKISK